MYEDTFGTDWEALSADDALRRMYALGVAASLGRGDDTEYRRVRAQADSAYARNVLELAFEEGRQRGRRDRRDRRDRRESGGDDPDADDVWAALVTDAESTAPAAHPASSPSRSAADRRPESAVPPAVTRSSLLELDGDDLERLRLPDLLERHD